MENVNNPLRVRTATEKDLPALWELEQGIIVAERPFDPTLKQQDSVYYNLPELLASPKAEVAVAEWNGEIIGAGYIRIKSSDLFYQHTEHGYIGFQFVKPAYRGKGVNGAVMEHLKQWARRQNLTELRLDVFHENIAARRAYEKAGFTNGLLQMRMSITD